MSAPTPSSEKPSTESSRRQDLADAQDGSEHADKSSSYAEGGCAAKGDVEKSPIACESEHDPNIVDYENEHDQLNAQNWPAKKKWGLVALLALMTFVTYVQYHAYLSLRRARRC